MLCRLFPFAAAGLLSLQHVFLLFLFCSVRFWFWETFTCAPWLFLHTHYRHHFIFLFLVGQGLVCLFCYGILNTQPSSSSLYSLSLPSYYHHIDPLFSRARARNHSASGPRCRLSMKMQHILSVHRIVISSGTTPSVTSHRMRYYFVERGEHRAMPITYRA